MKHLYDKLKRFESDIAFVSGEDSITYSELLSKSKTYAELLKKQGTEPVIIYGHKSVEMFISVISCLFAGRAYVPIDRFTPHDRIKNIIAQTKASLIIENEPIDLDCDIDKKSLEMLSVYAEEIKKDCSQNNTAYIIFTSGSTGEPKGVPISYDNLDNFADWISNIPPLNGYKSKKILNQASFSFDLSVADIYYSLFNGHTLVALQKEIQESFNGIFNVIKDNNINIMVVTPTFIKLCLINKDFNVKNFPELDCIYFCGEILDKKTVTKLFNAFPKINIINAYGPTEATSAVTATLIDKDMLSSDEALPVGDIRSSATEIEIIDNEIVLKGKSVFGGYLNNVTGGYYCENGINCYKTGDIGYIKNGRLFYSHRKDLQIKMNGYRIELTDIENNIKNIDGVADCAVVAKRSDDGTVKFIKAFVVIEDDNTAVDEIRKHLAAKLPPYMIPKIIKPVDKLPVNKNGKIDRKILEEKF